MKYQNTLSGSGQNHHSQGPCDEPGTSHIQGGQYPAADSLPDGEFAPLEVGTRRNEPNDQSNDQGKCEKAHEWEP